MLYVAIVGGALCALEFALRIEAISPPRRFRRAMGEIKRHLELLATMETHPFLQYTYPRTQLDNGDQEYGFQGIRLSDIAKPPEAVRIAWMGEAGETPRLLQAYLNDAAPSARYQVLDFGVDGWSSAHAMLNFVLNVREFHPDIALIQRDLKAAVCTGYPCSCEDAIHDYTPPIFQFNPLEERLLRISWIARAAKVLLTVTGARAEAADGRELRHDRRHIETICRLAAREQIRTVVLDAEEASRTRIAELGELILRPEPDEIVR